jgi:hypothetical protein
MLTREKDGLMRDLKIKHHLKTEELMRDLKKESQLITEELKSEIEFY